MQRRQLLALAWMGCAIAAEKKPRIRLASVKRTSSREERSSASFEFTLNSDEPFAVRALDPVLQVGAARLTHYRYGGERGEVLIFAAAPGTELATGANMRFQYGDDETTRVELGQFRGETKE